MKFRIILKEIANIIEKIIFLNNSLMVKFYSIIDRIFIMEDFFELLKDIFEFLIACKKYWIAPLILTILLVGALLVFTQGSVVFFYLFNFLKMKKIKGESFSSILNLLIFFY